MNVKKIISILLILMVIGIASVAAWEMCAAMDGVSISYSYKTVLLENKASEYRTVIFTVTFSDGTKAEYQQYAVDAKSSRQINYGKVIKSVAPCW